MVSGRYVLLGWYSNLSKKIRGREQTNKKKKRCAKNVAKRKKKKKEEERWMIGEL